jgi:hypothetical protein
MSTSLEFRFVAYDSVAVPLGFPDVQTADVITDIQEALVARWLFVDSPANALLLTELGLPEETNVWISVAEPVTSRRRRPGDVDVMLCKKDCPHDATVLETKCVKVVAEAEGPDKVNRLGKLPVAVKQANGLRETGFHSSYLAVVCLVDALHRPEPNVGLREMSSKTLSLVYDFPARDDLHKGVGFVIIEIAQPTTKGFRRMAKISVCRVRAAEVQVQATDLTNRIAEYLRFH